MFAVDNEKQSRWYRAPQLLLNIPHDTSCDIFSIGVILFILLTGYRPFELASSKDRWYKPMIKKKYELFWKAHRASPLAHNKHAKDLIEKMLSYDPKERISISDIKKHEWYNGKYLEGKDLISALRNRFVEKEMKRQKDSRKQAVKPIAKICGFDDFFDVVTPPMVPDDIDERINCLHTMEDWKELLYTLTSIIGSIGGFVEFDQESMRLVCALNIARQSQLENISMIRFSIGVFMSNLYNNDKVLKTLEEKSAETKAIMNRVENNVDVIGELTSAQRCANIRKEQLHARTSVKPCYVVQIKRISGDEVIFANKIKRNFLMKQCGCLFTGVPKDRLTFNDGNRKDDI